MHLNTFSLLSAFIFLLAWLVSNRTNQRAVFSRNTSKDALLTKRLTGMYEFLQQETLGLYRNLRLPCCLISEWTRSDKRILFLLSIFATPDIFLCLPFANTTDCMSPSCINIWWFRPLKVINKNFGLLPSSLTELLRG